MFWRVLRPAAWAGSGAFADLPLHYCPPTAHTAAGVGPGISGLAGGYIYESLGMRFVFVIFTAVLAAGWTMILLALRWATRGKRAAARGRACRAAELPAL